MDRTSDNVSGDKTSAGPSIWRKLVSGGTWGMLAGFWVEAPLALGFVGKAALDMARNGGKFIFDGHALQKWSLLGLPATLIGTAYGWTQAARDEARLEGKIERMEQELHARQMSPSSPQKSWVAAETQRPPVEINR